MQAATLGKLLLGATAAGATLLAAAAPKVTASPFGRCPAFPCESRCLGQMDDLVTDVPAWRQHADLNVGLASFPCAFPYPCLDYPVFFACALQRYGVTSLAKGAEAQANTVRKHMNSVQRAPQKSPQEVELEPAIDLDGLESYESIFPAWHHTKRLLSAKRQDSS